MTVQSREKETGVVVVYVTAPSEEVGHGLAKTLVEEGLCACVNVVSGVTSVYRWEGAVCEDREVLLIIKARATRLEALTERVRALHPYALPEVIATEIVGGSTEYLAWVRGA